MAGPITWRTVNGPSLAEASRPLEAAQRSFMGAFDGLRGTLKESEAFDKELWKRQDQEATQDALGKIYQAQTVDQMNALNQSGTLDQGVAANGARIDRAAVNALRDGRVSTLQNQATQAITYKNTMLDDAQANDVRLINTLALTDPTAASAELAKNSDLRKSFEIAKNIDASAQTVVERDRAKQRFGFDMSEEQRKADEEKRRVAAEAQKEKARPFEIKLLEDNLLNGPATRAAQAAQVIASKASAAASNESVLTSQANRERIKAEAEKAREVKKLGVALDGNIYKEGVYKDTDTVDLAKLMKDNSIGGKDEDATDSRARVIARLNQLAKTGLPVSTKNSDGSTGVVTVPLPLGAVKAAILSARDPWGWNNLESTFEDTLRKSIQSTYNKPGADGKPMAANRAVDDYQNFLAIMRGTAEIAPVQSRRGK